MNLIEISNKFLVILTYNKLNIILQVLRGGGLLNKILIKY